MRNKYIFSMVLFDWTTQVNSMKSSESEIGLEFEKKVLAYFASTETDK